MSNDAKGRTDRARRFVSAPAADVYAAFADGATLMEWLPPSNMTGRALEYNFEPGGSYRIELRYHGGQNAAAKTTKDSDISKGHFVELSPGRRIRQTVEFESGDETLARGMTMNWEFEPAASGTTVTVTAEGVPSAISKSDHIKGLTSSLENLARFVERSPHA